MSTVLPEPSLLIAVTAGAAVYLRGWRRRPPGAGTAGQLARFLGGLTALLVATSPWLEGAAARSFAWHMAQHQLLILLVAPLLASSRPLVTVRWAAGGSGVGPSRVRRWSSRHLGTFALAAAALHLGNVLAWHLPPLYDAAMSDTRLHHAEHLALLGTAVVAWGAILWAARDRGARALAAAVGLAVNALAGAGLGVVLLSAPVPLYAWYADLGAVALDDQRVGGASMKISAVVVYAGAAVWIVARWLHRLDADPHASAALPRPGAPTAGSRR